MTTQLVIYWILLILLIAINLSKQTKLNDPQQINIIGKFERQKNGATMLFVIEIPKETTFEFFQNSANIL